MLKVVIPSSDDGCAARLRALGFVVQQAASLRVPPLDAASAEEVWCVPQSVLQGPDWPRLRVELTRAPRLFVVCLETAGTQPIVSAMRDGAFDAVWHGDTDARWLEVVHAAAESQRLWLQLYAGQLATEGERLVGRSMALNQLRRDLERLGPTDVTVLLIGESGVGKERVARALHEAGHGGPLVTLNCAAMPRELVEAELFGAEKGAFTGAVRSRPGLVEQAAGGTLFLDEIGELDLTLQPKLLRFLETRRARRVGGDNEYAIQLRVVAATNRNLEQAVAEGQFRADLYYRLAEVVIQIPPLRERVEDIPALVQAFMTAASERFGKHFDAAEPGLLLRLKEYSWPGNVRELKSVIDRLVLFHEGPVLRAGWWTPPDPATVAVPGGQARAEAAGVNAGAGAHAAAAGWHGPLGGPALPNRSARIELARKLLEEGRLSLAEIAARAGVHPTTLFRWRKAGRTRKE